MAALASLLRDTTRTRCAKWAAPGRSQGDRLSLTSFLHVDETTTSMCRKPITATTATVSRISVSPPNCVGRGVIVGRHQDYVMPVVVSIVATLAGRLLVVQGVVSPAFGRWSIPVYGFSLAARWRHRLRLFGRVDHVSHRHAHDPRRDFTRAYALRRFRGGGRRSHVRVPIVHAPVLGHDGRQRPLCAPYNRRGSWRNNSVDKSSQTWRVRLTISNLRGKPFYLRERLTTMDVAAYYPTPREVERQHELRASHRYP
jgi:hypothetical protein